MVMNAGSLESHTMIMISTSYDLKTTAQISISYSKPTSVRSVHDGYCLLFTTNGIQRRGSNAQGFSVGMIQDSDQGDQSKSVTPQMIER